LSHALQTGLSTGSQEPKSYCGRLTRLAGNRTQPTFRPAELSPRGIAPFTSSTTSL
jgi:hypothetical protein